MGEGWSGQGLQDRLDSLASARWKKCLAAWPGWTTKTCSSLRKINDRRVYVGHGAGTGLSKHWGAEMARPRICYVLSLLRIHSPDCKHCMAHLTCGNELRKRLEELNVANPAVSAHPRGSYRLGRGEVARSRVPYRDQAFVWFERAVAASLSRVNHVAFSQPFGGGERRSLGGTVKMEHVELLESETGL